MAIQEAGQGQHQEEKPHPRGISRRKFLGLAGGAAAVAGATALGISLSQGGEENTEGLVVPGLASDGDGSGGESGNLPLTIGETPISTATPTVEATKTPESLYPSDSFRERARVLGKKVGTSVDLAEDFRSPAYEEAAGNNFNILFTDGSLLQSVVDKYGISSIQRFRELAQKNKQVLYAHPGIWHQDIPDTVKSGTKDVETFIDERVDLIMGMVRPTHGGDEPTFINFLNEATFAQVGGDGQVHTGWEKSVFYKTYGEDLMKQLYLKFYKAGVEKGLLPGTDFRLIYSDYDTYMPGPKADFVYNNLKKAKGDIARALEISLEDVQLDVAMQCHFDVAKTDGLLFHKVPTEDELRSSIGKFSEIGKVHLTEFNIRGTNDQGAKTDIMRMVAKVFSGSPSAESLTFWQALRQKARTPSDAKTFSNPGLFDQNYKTTGEYSVVSDSLVA